MTCLNHKHQEIEKQEALEFAVHAGEVLLKNGAEVFRVEETITHISKHYEIEDLDVFTLSNGFYITAKKEGNENFSKVKHVPLSGAHLGIVTEVNDLSRQVCSGNISLSDAKEKLKEIEKIPPKRPYFRILAAGIGSGLFSYLLEATVLDSLVTMLIGMMLYAFVIVCEKHKLSKLIVNTVGGGLITCLALLASILLQQQGMHLDKVIIGSILPLVPGVAFVNSIRDVTNNDLISGIVRLIDAWLIFVYIAVGVGTVLAFADNLLGGVIVL